MSKNKLMVLQTISNLKKVKKVLQMNKHSRNLRYQVKRKTMISRCTKKSLYKQLNPKKVLKRSA